MIDRKLLPIIFITFVNSIGFSIVIPIAPFIIEDLGGSAFLYGIVLSSYSIFQFLAAPFLGSLSDKYGRRKILLISHIGTLFSWVVFAAAFLVPSINLLGVNLSLWILILARILDGITGGNISVAAAYVSDVTKLEHKSKSFGIVDAVWGLGFMFGPIIGSYSSNWGYDYFGTIGISLLLSFITILSIIFILPESNPTTRRIRDFDISFREEISKAFKFMYSAVKYSSDKVVQDLLYERTFVAFVYTVFTSIFALYLKDHFDMSTKNVGQIFVVVGFFMIFDQVMLVPYFIKKFKDERTIEIAVFLIIIFSTIIPLFNSITKFLIVTFFLTLGFSLHFPTLKTLLIKNTPEKKHGEVVGIEESIFSLNQAVVPLISSFFYAHYSNKIFMFTALPLLAFALYKYGLFKGKVCQMISKK